MSVFSMKISARQHGRLQHAPVPRALAQIGIQRFGVADAVRFAVISLLARPTNPQRAATQSGDTWLQVSLPVYLACQLEERAATEHRSKASLVRDAIDLYLPPAQGEAVAGTPPASNLNAAMARVQFGDRTAPFTTSGFYR
jgi:hypothetical protein